MQRQGEAKPTGDGRRDGRRLKPVEIEPARRAAEQRDRDQGIVDRGGRAVGIDGHPAILNLHAERTDAGGEIDRLAAGGGGELHLRAGVGGAIPIAQKSLGIARVGEIDSQIEIDIDFPCEVDLSLALKVDEPAERVADGTQVPQIEIDPLLNRVGLLDREADAKHLPFQRQRNLLPLGQAERLVDGRFDLVEEGAGRLLKLGEEFFKSAAGADDLAERLIDDRQLGLQRGDVGIGLGEIGDEPAEGGDDVGRAQGTHGEEIVEGRRIFHIRIRPPPDEIDGGAAAIPVARPARHDAVGRIDLLAKYLGRDREAQVGGGVD